MDEPTQREIEKYLAEFPGFQSECLQDGMVCRQGVVCRVGDETSTLVCWSEDGPYMYEMRNGALVPDLNFDATMGIVSMWIYRKIDRECRIKYTGLTMATPIGLYTILHGFLGRELEKQEKEK